MSLNLTGVQHSEEERRRKLLHRSLEDIGGALADLGRALNRTSLDDADFVLGTIASGLERATCHIRGVPYGMPSEAEKKAVAEADSLRVRVEQMEKEIEELRIEVLAFGAPYAVQYAKEHGRPEMHLHPAHYDALKNAGGRMDDFVRGEE